MDINELYDWLMKVDEFLSDKQKKISVEILKEIRTRLKFLLDVGLDYLALNRSSVSLSGGESQRIRLATQIGSQFVNVLYILDELLDELIEQMKRSDAKINAVADLLYDKYLGTFLPLLPPNTDPKDFKQVFITMFRTTTGLQEELAGEVRDLAGS